MLRAAPEWMKHQKLLTELCLVTSTSIRTSHPVDFDETSMIYLRVITRVRNIMFPRNQAQQFIYQSVQIGLSPPAMKSVIYSLSQDLGKVLDTVSQQLHAPWSISRRQHGLRQQQQWAGAARRVAQRDCGGEIKHRVDRPSIEQETYSQSSERRRVRVCHHRLSVVHGRCRIFPSPHRRQAVPGSLRRILYPPSGPVVLFRVEIKYQGSRVALAGLNT